MCLAWAQYYVTFKEPVHPRIEMSTLLPERMHVRCCEMSAWNAVICMNACSLHVPCLCIRGVVRQLGRPALLAAMYSGDGPGAAAAAMAEVEGVLVSSLHELERGGAGTAGGRPSSIVPSRQRGFAVEPLNVTDLIHHTRLC